MSKLTLAGITVKDVFELSVDAVRVGGVTGTGNVYLTSLFKLEVLCAQFDDSVDCSEKG